MPSKQKRKTDESGLTPEQFLSAYPPDIQALANHLRTLVKQTVVNLTAGMIVE
jgi:hypothetical protein